MPEPEPDATRRNPFTCSCSTDGDEVVIWLGGELDIAARAAFVEAVDAVLPDGKAIVADLSGLNFIDSAGISSILQCRNTAAAAGLPFHIRGAGWPGADGVRRDRARRLPRHIQLTRGFGVARARAARSRSRAVGG